MLRFLLLSLLMFALLTCSKSIAGLTIPANQMFVLGEYMTSDYSATLTNEGKQAVSLQVISQSDGQVMRSLALLPGSTERVEVISGEQVQMMNAGGEEANILVVMSKGVEGMRMQSMDGESLPALEPQVTFDLPDPVDAFRTEPTDRFESKLSPGECYLVGEGGRTSYVAQVKTRGEALEVRVLREESSAFVRGFGLGAGSRESISIDSGEVLYLCNEGERALKMSVQLTAKLPGGRRIGPVK
ncbi:MAG: hypothetical protein WA952_21325 [Lewinella sp.]